MPELNKKTAHPDPFTQFGDWYGQAVQLDRPEPTAVTLATATADGKPSARVVLLKSWDTDGFVFYSNYDSRKGQELLANPWACLCFWWGDLVRQVRIEGSVKHIAADQSDRYFHSRPRASQLGAVASPQSQIIADQASLQSRYERLSNDLDGVDVPRPTNWGGYRLQPDVFEFWQGQEFRLHDRLRYSRTEGSDWEIERLAP